MSQRCDCLGAKHKHNDNEQCRYPTTNGGRCVYCKDGKCSDADFVCAKFAGATWIYGVDPVKAEDVEEDGAE